MQVIHTVSELKNIRKSLTGKKIGFVPTMGGLHEGHLSLVRKSIIENDVTFVSIYLNSTQFNDKNDFLTYPANFEDDVNLLKAENTDYIFAPDYDEMYPDDYKYHLSETDFSRTLCGEKRPGHFDGVLTVVMKLFNIIKPDNAYFGEKDFQQYKLLDGMVKAFFMDINIIPCPIVREKSGLAMSSRNRKLSEGGLKKASLLHKILEEKSTAKEKKESLKREGFTVDYLTQKDERLYAAVFLEGVRLIDNIRL